MNFSTFAKSTVKSEGPFELLTFAFSIFTKESGKGMRELLGFKFANGNSSTRAPLRAGIDGSKAWI